MNRIGTYVETHFDGAGRNQMRYTVNRGYSTEYTPEIEDQYLRLINLVLINAFELAHYNYSQKVLFARITDNLRSNCALVDINTQVLMLKEKMLFNPKLFARNFMPAFQEYITKRNEGKQASPISVNERLAIYDRAANLSPEDVKVPYNSLGTPHFRKALGL